MADQTHLLGLLLGTEEDWPSAFEALVRRAQPTATTGRGRAKTTHRFTTERITIEPFDLRQVPRYELVIDRLAYWYYHPREWLKKVALMNDVYLLNNPFTFQSMEKHSAYCAMIRLGLKVPDTWLVPYKQPIADERFAYVAGKYNREFNLEDVAARIGYPLFMKPFDGGAWVGVSRINDAQQLRARYDESGQRLMHLQKAVDPFDVFARSLSIGAETMVMNFDPDQPLHGRYRVDHDFLTPEVGAEVINIGRTVNAFFRWEFNSCETLIRGTDVHPIDYANACPDVSIISLHYYFPWAIESLLKWSIFCIATDRRMGVSMNAKPWFDIADSDRSYDEKIAAYGRLAEAYFETGKYHEFCARHLGSLHEQMVEYIESSDFDALLVDTIVHAFPPHEHEHFIAHYRGLLGAWAKDQRALAA